MALLSRAQPEADLGDGWQFCWKSASLDLKHKRQHNMYSEKKRKKCFPVWVVQHSHRLVHLQMCSETCQQLPLLTGKKLKSRVCSGGDRTLNDDIANVFFL